MKITLSRDEIKSMVAEHYGIHDADFFLEISSERAAVNEKNSNSSISSDQVIVVNNNNQVIDLKSSSDSKPRKPNRHAVKERGLFKNCEVCGKKFIPKNAKVRTCSNSCRSKLIYKERKDKGTYKSPKRDTVDCQKYGLIIEDFLNSSDSTRPIDLEGLSNDGMLYRYRKASTLFNFDDKVTFSREGKILKMVKQY